MKKILKTCITHNVLYVALFKCCITHKYLYINYLAAWYLADSGVHWYHYETMNEHFWN